MLYLILPAVAVLLVISIIVAVAFRTVVPTNDVHIVQSSKTTTSYGRGLAAGNTYYSWPSWVPLIGVKTIALPVSVFDQSLTSYAAYDKDRVPFQIDIIAFFRITDSNMAAERISSFEELKDQLRSILQGAVRTILASSNIDHILEGRSEFGDKFTKEVDHQLKEWGVQTVKCIELMDIRDAEGSKVIANIMEKKKSFIEMESRVEVAENRRKAETAEIEAAREIQINRVTAEQHIGIKAAEKDQQIGIANEQSQQNIKEQARITAEKTMAVQQVENVRKAEIVKEVEVVKAEQDKQTTVLVAQGHLESTRLHAEGIQVEGQAKAEAEKAMQLAPVEAQITLAREIGTNEGYQKYLISIRTVEATETVGIEQAKALQAAEIKVIANAGEPTTGVDTVMNLFSARGGTQLGAMLEAVQQTDAGRALIQSFTKPGEK